MKLICVAALAVVTASCASTPTPNFINGRYFMAGDAGCARYNIALSGEIDCYDKAGNYTGRRSAMTASDMQIYSAQQAYQAEQYAQLQAKLDATNAQLQRQSQQFAQLGSSYTPPAVTPLPSQSSYTAFCNNLGGSFSCRSPLPEANFICVKAGDFYHCRPRG